MLRQFLFLGLVITSIALVQRSSMGADKFHNRWMEFSGTGFLTVSFTDATSGTWEATESGHAKGFGRYTMVQSGTFSIIDGNFVFEGQGTWTAGNGDQLYVVCGFGIPVDGTQPGGVMAITGGTGKFTHAEGLFSLELYIDESQDPWPYTVTGSGGWSY